MKTILLFSILFCVIAMPLHAELSESDLNQIRLIVDDVVKKEITASEKRMKEHIDIKIESLEKRFNLVVGFVSALMALIVITVGIRQIIIAWQSRKNRNQESYIGEPTREM